MGKKRHQLEPNMDKDNDSTESCDENQNAALCPHVGKAIDLGKVKRELALKGILVECPQCNGSSSEESDYEYDLSLWLCLRCGNQGCGRSKNKHALCHYSKPRSDCHALCVNTSMWMVWCYECDNMISPSSKKKLLEAVEWIKKQSGQVKKPPIVLEFPMPCVETENMKNVAYSPPRVRGLINLGNTCFFNSVLQCLAQTPFFMSVIYEPPTQEKHFVLPGGTLALDKSVSLELPPLEGELIKWGSFTETLYKTLQELTSGAIDVYNPQELFSQLIHRQPLFGGGEQHDAHELLRFLLEDVRTEDLRRYQFVILDKLGLSRKTDPSTVNVDCKQKIKFYGQQASDLMIKMDQVFRGVLVSTLQCQECKHSSHRDEFFLDLSLPVSGEKPMPSYIRRKSETDALESEKQSKSQTRKERRTFRKARRQIKNSGIDNTITEELHPEKYESEESDADVEDNLEETKSSSTGDDSTKGLESGYNSEKVSDASPELNNLDNDSGVTSPLTVTVPSPTGAEVDSSNSGASSDANIELPSPQLQSGSPEDYERPISRLSFAEKPIQIIEDKSEPLPETSGITKSNNTYYSNNWCNTVSARHQCEEDEWSVYSCLNQFTACELLTGNNRVRCDNCTKCRNDAGQSVYSNATKQFLVSSPPAILILHLKRFQMARCIPKKVSKHVTFPVILDMAPYCSTRCRELPSVDNKQSSLLYSLYGVVEHSGSLHGGHYTAYVKVRPKLPENHYRWQFLNRSTAKSDETDKPASTECGGGDISTPPGKWYYVSDTFVSEVSENKVLNAQAYLLFYERIL